MDLPSSRPAASEVTLQTAGSSAADASQSPSEVEAPTREANGLLLQEAGEKSTELREEPAPAERDSRGAPETRQGVDDVGCDAATAPAVGAPAGSEGEWQAPTSDSGSPPPRKTKRGRRSSTHRAELKLEVERQSRCEEVVGEKIRVEGAGLAPWQCDFDCEDVFRPVASSVDGRRSVRRSLRNRSSYESGGEGLAWLPPSPTNQPAEPRRRTRGRRLSSGQPL